VAAIVCVAALAVGLFASPASAANTRADRANYYYTIAGVDFGWYNPHEGSRFEYAWIRARDSTLWSDGASLVSNRVCSYVFTRYFPEFFFLKVPCEFAVKLAVNAWLEYHPDYYYRGVAVRWYPHVSPYLFYTSLVYHQ